VRAAKIAVLAVESGKSLLLDREICETLAKTKDFRNDHRLTINHQLSTLNFSNAHLPRTPRFHVTTLAKKFFRSSSNRTSRLQGQLTAVAEAKHVRPVFLERQPRDQRHATMLSALTKPNLDAAAAASSAPGWSRKTADAHRLPQRPGDQK